MATSLDGTPPLSDQRVQEILTVAKNWCLCHGVGIRAGSEEPEHSKVICGPFSLFPSSVPCDLVSDAKTLTRHYSRLYHRVAMDHAFMERALNKVVEVDVFIRGLWKIYCHVREEGIAQPIMVGLFRNDLMMALKTTTTTTTSTTSSKPESPALQADKLQLKQVEMNTIGCSYSGLSQSIGDMHRMTLRMAGRQFSPDQMPENKPASGFASGLVKAWELYGNPKAVINICLGIGETCILDVHFIEFEVYKINPKIRVLRKGLMEIYERGQLDDSKNLIIDGDEVAVVYLRTSFTTDNCSSKKDWAVRLTVERSRAVKCPPIQYQLVGAKKIQQELTRPGALERFVDDAAIADMLRASFVDQYSLDLGPEGDAAVALARKNPDSFVLKPQREGGVYNCFGKDILDVLNKCGDSDERCANVLMERIVSCTQANYLYKEDTDTTKPLPLSSVITELGIFDVYIGTTEGDELENSACGYTMKTKDEEENHGGIFPGGAVFDTPLLV